MREASLLRNPLTTRSPSPRALAFAWRRRRGAAADEPPAEPRGQGPALRRRAVPLLPGPLLHVGDDADGLAALRARPAPRRRGRRSCAAACCCRTACTSEAGEIFAQADRASAAPKVRDRAWFFLAKIRYQRGYLPEAERRPRAGRGQPARAACRKSAILLQANLLMAHGDYAGAAAMLERHVARRRRARATRATTSASRCSSSTAAAQRRPRHGDPRRPRPHAGRGRGVPQPARPGQRRPRLHRADRRQRRSRRAATSSACG